jgi:inner membrane protein
VPTVFSHAVAAVAMGQFQVGKPLPAGFWQWTVICSMLPDADVVGFAFGIRYGDLLGHRGLSHSFLFAALTGCLVAAVLTRNAPGSGRAAFAVYFSLVTASHTVLDALTDGGLGVAFFSPFSQERFFLPWRPIEVSPIGPRFFGARGADVLLSELRWVWMPSLLVAAAAWVSRRPRGLPKRREG